MFRILELNLIFWSLKIEENIWARKSFVPELVKLLMWDHGESWKSSQWVKCWAFVLAWQDYSYSFCYWKPCYLICANDEAPVWHYKLHWTSLPYVYLVRNDETNEDSIDINISIILILMIRNHMYHRLKMLESLKLDNFLRSYIVFE